MQQQLDLMCETKTKVGSIGSSYFLGWVMTLLWVPALADIYGRARLFQLGMVLDLILMTTCMMTTSLNVMIVSVFLIGVCSSLRVTLGYIYMMEFIPMNRRTFVGTFLFVIEALIVLAMVLYYMLSEGRNWLTFTLFGYCFQVYAVFGSMMLPESPKWLIEQKRLDEASSCLETIAKWNNRQLTFNEKNFIEDSKEQVVEAKPLWYWLN